MNHRTAQVTEPHHTIPLPFPVQKVIVNMHKMGNNAGARILCVELRAVEYNDYKVPARSKLTMIN